MSSGAFCEQEIERIFFGFGIQAQKQLSSKLTRPRKKVIVISGPTAVGKTNFSLELARELGGEIVSADSMQIYRGMDIGTAKLKEEDRQGIPHHLIDICDVQDNYNVVDFYYESRHACQEILGRGGVPIVVGGSGFYLHSLIFGPPNGPPSVPEVRKKLEEELEARGIEAMFEKLKRLDPQYAASITCNDKQKIVRGIEIIQLTGKRVSKMTWKGRRKPLNFDFRCWFLYRPREHLYRLIDKRCDQMILEGFLDEVEMLDKNGIRVNSSASQAIGYRQALDYLKSKKTKEDYKIFIEKFKQATRNFAKRQFTWFRQEPSFRWLDMDLHDFEVALDMVVQDYHAGSGS